MLKTRYLHIFFCFRIITDACVYFYREEYFLNHMNCNQMRSINNTNHTVLLFKIPLRCVEGIQDITFYDFDKNVLNVSG